MGVVELEPLVHVISVRERYATAAEPLEAPSAEAPKRNAPWFVLLA